MRKILAYVKDTIIQRVRSEIKVKVKQSHYKPGQALKVPRMRFSPPIQTDPGAHPASCTMGIGSFPGVKSGRGVTLTPHPLLVPLVMKE